MTIIVIDNIQCIKCRDCVEKCPENLFYSPPTEIGEKRQVSFKDPNKKCTFCGHVSIFAPLRLLVTKMKIKFLQNLKDRQI